MFHFLPRPKSISSAMSRVTRSSRPEPRCLHKLSPNLFPLEFKSFRKRPFLSVQTAGPILFSLICLAFIVSVEGFGIGLGAVTGETMLKLGEQVGRLGRSHDCGSKRDMMRGDIGVIQQVLEKLQSPEYAAEGRGRSSRRKRFIVFPSSSTLSFETSLTIPAASYNNGYQVLKKYMSYKIVMKLPTERLIIPGFKKVVVVSDYGPPRPDSVVYGDTPPATYGTPSAPAPAPTYGTPSAPAPAPTYGVPSAPAPAPAPTYGTPSAPAPSPSYSAPGPFSNSGGDSSYNNYQKDIQSALGRPSLSHQGPVTTFSDTPANAHHFGVFREPPGWQNYTEVDAPTTFSDGAPHQHHHPHHLIDPSEADPQGQIIMSEMDHQRLLGFMAIEQTFESSGLPGRWCLLKAVCEVAAEPLADLGLVGEMIDLFLAAGYGDGSPALMEYMIAEEIGYTDGACNKHFTTCPVDLADLLGESAAVLSNVIGSADHRAQF